MLKKIITTKRLILEPIKKKYFEIMYALIKENNVELSKWLPIDYPVQRKKTYEFYKIAMKDKNQSQYIIKDTKTKEIMGGLGLTKNQLNNNTTLGYWLAKEFRRKGYMTEAVQAMIDFCFAKEKVMRIEITAHEKNSASQRVIEKCGLQYEGTKRMGVRNGYKEYGDVKMYGILLSEWKRKS